MVEDRVAERGEEVGPRGGEGREEGDGVRVGERVGEGLTVSVCEK